jgi:hypothetical protein
MTCLKNNHIQALADGEATDDMRRHVETCASCAARLREREALIAQMRATVDPPVDIPAPVAEVFRLKAEATRGVGARGSTRLREDANSRSSRRFGLQAEGKWLYGSLAVAAATLMAVLFVAPAIRKNDATVSASEILAKSATQLAAAAQGVEILEYELVLDGVPKEMLPDQVDGAYRVHQAIDHNVPGRFRFASFAADGTMITSIAQDPAARRRVLAFTSEGQPYRYEVTLPQKSEGLSLPEMQRLHMQASIALMQASGNQLLETMDGPDGKLYRIEVPRVSGPGSNPVWDLNEARVLIDGRDYHIKEFFVRGSFLKRDYSMSFKLITRLQAATMTGDLFEVPHQPNEIVIRGEGSAVPAHDVVMLGLRELTRLKTGR